MVENARGSLALSGCVLVVHRRARRRARTTSTARFARTCAPGPGLEFRILKILPAGAVVQTLARDGEWIQVRVSDLEGWVPTDNVSKDEPATALLPRVREKLVAAEGQISELDQKLVAQTAQLEELALAARAQPRARVRRVARGRERALEVADRRRGHRAGRDPDRTDRAARRRDAQPTEALSAMRGAKRP